MWGVVLCALAASIKVPAAIGIVYVAWDWAGPVRRLAPARCRPLVRAGADHGGGHGRLSPGVGPGLGLDRQPGHTRHRPLVDGPATGFGLLISGTAHLVGIGVGLGGVLTLTRAIGLIGAAAIAVYCLRNGSASASSAHWAAP